MYKFIFLLILLFFVACNNNLQIEQKKCRSLIQKEIESNPYYSELIAFEKHLIEYKLLVKNEKKSHHNLVLKLLKTPSSFHTILNLYEHNYQYNLNIKNDCQYTPTSYTNIRTMHQELYDKLNHNSNEESLIQFKELVKNTYKNLDNNFIQSKMFNYITLHQLYTSSLQSKVDLLNTLNLNITIDHLFIEDQVTTMATLKEDLELVIQHKKDFLKSLKLKDKLKLNLYINPKVKMGRVMGITALIKSINYNHLTSSIIIK